MSKSLVCAQHEQIATACAASPERQCVLWRFASDIHSIPDLPWILTSMAYNDMPPLVDNNSSFIPPPLGASNGGQPGYYPAFPAPRWGSNHCFLFRLTPFFSVGLLQLASTGKWNALSNPPNTTAQLASIFAGSTSKRTELDVWELPARNSHIGASSTSSIYMASNTEWFIRSTSDSRWYMGSNAPSILWLSSNAILPLGSTAPTIPGSTGHILRSGFWTTRYRRVV